MKRVLDDKKHQAREALIWQNGYVGRPRRMVRVRGIRRLELADVAGGPSDRRNHEVGLDTGFCSKGVSESGLEQEALTPLGMRLLPADASTAARVCWFSRFVMRRHKTGDGFRFLDSH